VEEVGYRARTSPGDTRVRGAVAWIALWDQGGRRPPRTAPMRSAVVARWQSALDAPGADRAFAEGRAMEEEAPEAG